LSMVPARAARDRVRDAVPGVLRRRADGAPRARGEHHPPRRDRVPDPRGAVAAAVHLTGVKAVRPTPLISGGWTAARGFAADGDRRARRRTARSRRDAWASAIARGRRPPPEATPARSRARGRAVSVARPARGRSRPRSVPDAGPRRPESARVARACRRRGPGAGPRAAPATDPRRRRGVRRSARWTTCLRAARARWTLRRRRAAARDAGPIHAAARRSPQASTVDGRTRNDAGTTEVGRAVASGPCSRLRS